MLQIDVLNFFGILEFSQYIPLTIPNAGSMQQKVLDSFLTQVPDLI